MKNRQNGKRKNKQKWWRAEYTQGTTQKGERPRRKTKRGGQEHTELQDEKEANNKFDIGSGGAFTVDGDSIKSSRQGGLPSTPGAGRRNTPLRKGKSQSTITNYTVSSHIEYQDVIASTETTKQKALRARTRSQADDEITPLSPDEEEVIDKNIRGRDARKKYTPHPSKVRNRSALIIDQSLLTDNDKIIDPCDPNRLNPKRNWSDSSDTSCAGRSEKSPRLDKNPINSTIEFRFDSNLRQEGTITPLGSRAPSPSVDPEKEDRAPNNLPPSDSATVPSITPIIPPPATSSRPEATPIDEPEVPPTVPSATRLTPTPPPNATQEGNIQIDNTNNMEGIETSDAERATDHEVTDDQLTADSTGSHASSADDLNNITPEGSNTSTTEGATRNNAATAASAHLRNTGEEAFDPDSYVHPAHMPYRVKLISTELITLTNGNKHLLANKILAHFKRNGRQITIRRAYKINNMAIIIVLNDQHAMNLLLKKSTWDKAPWATTSTLPDHGPDLGNVAVIFKVPPSLTNDIIKPMITEKGIEVTSVFSYKKSSAASTGSRNSNPSRPRMVKVTTTSRESLKQLVKGCTDEEGTITLGAKSYNIEVFAHTKFGRCNLCQNRGHPASQCIYAPVCANCSSREHKAKYRTDEAELKPSSWEGNNCPNPTFCVNCGSSEHNAASRACPSHKKWMDVIKKSEQNKRAKTNMQGNEDENPDQTEGQALVSQSPTDPQTAIAANSQPVDVRQQGDTSPKTGTPPAAPVAEQEKSLPPAEWPRLPQGRKTQQGKPAANQPWKPTGPKEQEKSSNPKEGSEEIQRLTAMVNKQQKSIEALQKMLTSFISQFDSTGRAMLAPPVMDGAENPEDTSEIDLEAEITLAAEQSDVDDKIDATLGAHAGGARTANQRKSRLGTKASDKLGKQSAIAKDRSQSKQSSKRNWSASGRRNGPLSQMRMKEAARGQPTAPKATEGDTPSSSTGSTGSRSAAALSPFNNNKEIQPIRGHESGLLEISLQDLRHIKLYHNKGFIMIQKCDLNYLNPTGNPRWPEAAPALVEDNQSTQTSTKSQATAGTEKTSKYNGR